FCCATAKTERSRTEANIDFIILYRCTLRGFSLLQSIRVQQNLARLAGLQPRHALGEILERDAVSDRGRKVQLPTLQQRLHLVPRLVHPAAVDSLHRRAFENDALGEIKFKWLCRGAQQGDSSTHAQNIEAAADGVRIAGHLRDYIYA